MPDNHGLRTLAEIDAARQNEQTLKRCQAQSMRAHSVRRPFPIDIQQAAPPTPAPPSTARLKRLGVICLLSAGAVMVLWSVTLGFVLAIVAALVIAGAAWGEGQ